MRASVWNINRFEMRIISHVKESRKSSVLYWGMRRLKGTAPWTKTVVQCYYMCGTIKIPPCSNNSVWNNLEWTTNSMLSSNQSWYHAYWVNTAFQPGMVILSIDGQSMLGVRHATAVDALRSSFSNKRKVNMTLVLHDQSCPGDTGWNRQHISSLFVVFVPVQYKSIHTITACMIF